MIRTKVLTAILTGVSLITAVASARDDDFMCPVAAPAKVKVNFARSAEHVEMDVSLQQVREAAEGHHPGPVLGLYVGTLRDRFEGSCLCGAVRFVATGQPESVVWAPRSLSGDVGKNFEPMMILAPV